MYYVQIVDDEPITRTGLSKMVDWGKYGFEVACLAQNGKQALEQQEAEEIDMIITDIEMPLMNGLQFIKQVREEEVENNRKAKEIIVLTAYDEFQYAKMALRYGVKEYILKPFDIEEIEKILIKVKENLDERFNDKE